MREREGVFVVQIGGSCGVTIRQKNMAYLADSDGPPCHDPSCWHVRIMSGADDLFGPPTVARELGWCGCGDHESVDLMMLAYLRSRANAYAFPKPKPGGVSADAVMLLEYLADELGWAEHGSVVSAAWLTSDGKEALASLEKMYG